MIGVFYYELASIIIIPLFYMLGAIFRIIDKYMNIFEPSSNFESKQFRLIFQGTNCPRGLIILFNFQVTAAVAINRKVVIVEDTAAADTVEVAVAVGAVEAVGVAGAVEAVEAVEAADSDTVEAAVMAVKMYLFCTKHYLLSPQKN